MEEREKSETVNGPGNCARGSYICPEAVFSRRSGLVLRRRRC